MLALLAVLLILSYAVSVALGPILLYLTPQGIKMASERVTTLPISLFIMVNFEVAIGINTGLFFVALWVLYLCAFVLAWTEKPNVGSSLKSCISGRLDVLRSNYIVLMPCLTSTLFVVVVLLQTLQESVGVQTGSIEFQNPFIGYLIVSYAPLVEELSFRITTIGVFGGLYLLWKARRVAQDIWPGSARVLLLYIWSPETTKRLLGYNTIEDNGPKRGVLNWEWLLLGVTSASFGVAHYLSGAGWEIGKISTALISGLALGFVYLRYGVYAPVLLHWFFNYYLGTYDLASQLEVPGFEWITIGIELLNLAAGIAVIVILTLNSLSGRLSKVGLAGPLLDSRSPNVS